MAERIYQSVGNRGVNNTVDVKTVQTLLNKNIKLLAPHLHLKVDGDCGPVTIGMIVEFQKRVLKNPKPDGKIDPDGSTFTRLTELSESRGNTSGLLGSVNNLLVEVQQWLMHFWAANSESGNQSSAALAESDYQNAANVLGVGIATIKAVARVESSGSGFLPNGKPKVLFEGQHFSKFTAGKYDKTHPSLSYEKFTTKFYNKDGVAEFARYETAKGLDRQAAMLSASWGAFQIMGFNFKSAGYGSVEQFVEAMHVSEAKQLLAFVELVKAQKLDGYLKACDWATFARRYNGPEYAVNKYDKRIKQAYEAFSAGGAQ